MLHQTKLTLSRPSWKNVVHHRRFSHFVDTHTHLDMILARAKVPFHKLQQYQEENFTTNFDACVTVACHVCCTIFLRTYNVDK